MYWLSRLVAGAMGETERREKLTARKIRPTDWAAYETGTEKNIADVTRRSDSM